MCKNFNLMLRHIPHHQQATRHQVSWGGRLEGDEAMSLVTRGNRHTATNLKHIVWIFQI